ncbi:cation:proton antiporter [Candidatus Woesearchaeota archaeon]|nr:cation:proton antiporter [Candidatus Woesearchaeota archaeon]
MNPEIFTELSIILLITLVITGIIKILRQPAIIGYIISGIFAGPFVFNIISSHDTLYAFSQIGVALLLFLVGLNLNPKVIKDVGKISLVAGLGQVIFTTTIGFFIIRYFGFDNVTSLYMAIALAFSSTIIIMKLLSDKHDLETLYGKISIGFLIVQDFIAIFILLVISTLNSTGEVLSFTIGTILKGLGSLSILFLLTIYILPSLTNKIAKSQEYLLLFSITWCFIIASAFNYLNFSIEAGALLAGITLSMSPYHFEISSRLRPLRDFFLILFFIILGSEMVFSNVIQNLPAIIILSLFVLIGNPLIVMIIMGTLGYTKRNGFLCGLTVAQISEFSLILITLGISVGHLDKEVLSVVTKIGLITFAGSTYLIIYSNKIYSKISKYLQIFERKGSKVDEHKYHENDDHDIILFGYNRIGLDIMESLRKIKKKFLIIDYDPEIINRLSKEGYDCRYGDANDSELLNELNFSKAKMIISTIPLVETNLLIINKIKETNKKTIISVVAHEIEDAELLYEQGATYVIMPHFLGGQHFSTMIERNKLKMNKFLEEKIKHLEHLNKRKRINSRPLHHHR